MKNRKRKLESFEKKDYKDLDTELIKELKNESDRGAVIVAVALIDIALISQIKSKFFNCSSNDEEELFYKANSPLSTFSAKINLAYHLGIISKRLKIDLHTIRSIRNSFAHDIENCSFKTTEVKNKIDEIKKNSRFTQFRELRDDFPNGIKGDFIMFISLIMSFLTIKSTENKITEPEEWFYNYPVEKVKEL